MDPEGRGSLADAVLVELQALRGRSTAIQGSIVSTTDGLVIAHDLAAAETYGVEPEGVAALSAVNLSLGQRIADTASHGELRETVIRGAFGQVVTYAAGDRALLTVLVRNPVAGETEMPTDARGVAERVGSVITEFWSEQPATWGQPA